MEDFVSRFAKILEEMSALPKKDLDDLRKNFRGRGQDAVIDFLLFEGVVDKGILLDALARFYNTPSFDVTGFLFDHELVSSFPVDFLEGNAIIPLTDEQDIITVVAADPTVRNLTPRIEEYTDSVVRYVVGLKQDILDAIEEFSQISDAEENFEGLDQEFQDRVYRDEEEPSDTSLIDDDYF